MKLSLDWSGSRVFLVLVALAWTPLSLGASGPERAASAAEYQLLKNPGMEAYDAPYTQFRGINCQVASDWQRFWYDGPEPYWMDTRVFASSPLGSDWVEQIEGATSQMVLSTEPYTAGLWQRVNGLTPGVGYGFHAAMLTIFQSSAQPEQDGTMIKQVGIDPTGGTDPRAPAVIWSEPNGRDKSGWDVRRRVSAYAQSDTLTVFIRVISPHEAGPWPFLNQSFFDSAILARTGTVRATSPEISTASTFTVRWDNAEPSSSGEIRSFDVQWMDEADGLWHDWLTRVEKDQVQASFGGQRGHTYRFRARVWERYPNGAHLTSPYRPEGDTRTYVGWARLTGRVLSNEGHPLPGATVAISGTGYSTLGKGAYELGLPEPVAQPAVVVSHPYWLSPAPVYGLEFGKGETVSFDWSLRPPDDAVLNGGFEQGLENWQASTGWGPQPRMIADPVHSGRGALALGGDAEEPFTAGVTQTATLAHAWEPALSFWYCAVDADAGDQFRVTVSVSPEMDGSQPPEVLAAKVTRPADAGPDLAVPITQVWTPALDAEDWQQVSLLPLPEATFTGTVAIAFEVWNDGDGRATTVYVDEVSLGATPGGPVRGYLPFIRQAD